jgi:hypothetical protein
MEDFDRTGLKVKIGEQEPDNGPLRQDELYIPSDYFAQQRGSGGGPAPPFPPPNCANNLDWGDGYAWPEDSAGKLGYWPEEDCPEAYEFEGLDGPDPEGDSNQFEPDGDGRCLCTGPGKDCACIREFLLHTRPPGINGYDGLDLNIEIVEDDACGVLFDLMAGSIEDPLEQTNGARRAGAAPSLVLALLAAFAVLLGWHR